MSIRVLLVDDHTIMRQGLQGLLKDCADIKIVGEASNGREGLTAARTCKPDVILMDMAMPVMDGIEATRQIKAEMPDCRVLGLSMKTDKYTLENMLLAGASGFLSKNAGKEELLRAIHAAMIGGVSLSPEVTRSLITEFTVLSRKRADPKLSGLTPKELCVLRLLADGWNTKEIALELKANKKTVDVWRRNLMKKTNCSGIADLVRLAIRYGLSDIAS